MLNINRTKQIITKLINEDFNYDSLDKLTLDELVTCTEFLEEKASEGYDIYYAFIPCIYNMLGIKLEAKSTFGNFERYDRYGRTYFSSMPY